MRNKKSIRFPSDESESGENKLNLWTSYLVCHKICSPSLAVCTSTLEGHRYSLKSVMSASTAF